MKILVTGGLGYIGSHTVIELSKKFEILIVDNLINSELSNLNRIKKLSVNNIEFENVDLSQKDEVSELFTKYTNIHTIFHFAALKSVSESVENPKKYHDNNVFSVQNIINEIKKRKLTIDFIFSSSCTVYGLPDKLPLDENHKLNDAISPYARTKQICESILIEYSSKNKDFNTVILRYFNPIGAHPSSEIGELPIGQPQNLIPFITQTVAGIRDFLTVFGDDYETPDGTCIRDYIYIGDLAKAHICAMNYLVNNKCINHEIFNLGTGKGFSVFEIIKLFEKTTGKKINYKVGSRRKGDLKSAYSDNKKAIEVLKWKPEISIEKALLTAWNWEKKISTLKT